LDGIFLVLWKRETNDAPPWLIGFDVFCRRRRNVTYPNYLTSLALLNKTSKMTIVHVSVLTKSEFFRAIRNPSAIARAVAVTKNTVWNRGHLVEFFVSIVMLRSLQHVTARWSSGDDDEKRCAALSNNIVNDTHTS
jgi:hypothetical protein